MEPVDPRMAELLGAAASGGSDELRSIVSRASRARNRLAAAAAGVALAAGGGIGFGISAATSGSTQQIVATSPASPSGSSGPSAESGPASAYSGSSGAVAEPAVPQPKQLKKLFTRLAGPIDIRGFLSAGSAIPAGVPTMCFLGSSPRFQADVSTPDMVGIVSGMLFEGSATSGPIEYAEPSVLGSLEGSPTTVVVAHTSSDVARLKMDFTGGGSDAMTPVQGWSALAAPYSGAPAGSPGTSTSASVSYGTLTAFDKTGHTLATQAVELGPRPLLPGAVGGAAASASGSGTSTAVCCGGVSGAPGSGYGSGPSGSGTSGSGTSGSGSSGSGSSGPGTYGSGSAGSGAVSSPPASVASPPASTPVTTIKGSTSPGGAVYPCKAVPLPAQVTPNSTVANPGSGG